MNAPSRDETIVPLPAVRSVLAILAGIALVLFLLSCIDVATDERHALLRQFDTGREANVPTWFSSAMWLAAGGLALAVGAGARIRRDPGAARWLLVGGAFTLMALDETGQLHEETVGPVMDRLRDGLGIGQTPARLVAVACAVVVLAAAAAWLWPWLRSLPRALWRGLVLAGAVFVSGSLGLEVVARLAETGSLPWFDETGYLSAFEELAEMLGVALLVAALLPYVPGVVMRDVRTSDQPGWAPAA